MEEYDKKENEADQERTRQRVCILHLCLFAYYSNSAQNKQFSYCFFFFAWFTLKKKKKKRWKIWQHIN